jgi:NADH dehydrogenase (ubiquinone) 1 alpha subcomplex subunit 2
LSWTLIPGIEFGVEKSESLVGLSDKEIEDKVAGLVKPGV